MASPNFIYIGPNKAGSTWLFEALKHHPQVFMSRAKELHYFDLYYSLGSDWYFNHFDGAGHNHVVVGEISHDYLYSVDACKRMKTDLRDLMLMVCLREPVERAFSEYLYMRRQGILSSESFEDAIKGHPEIIEHSLYASNLNMYQEYFGTDSLIVTIFDDLREDSMSYYKMLCRRLNIDECIPNIFPSGEVLGSARPRFHLAAKIAKKSAMFMRDLGLAEYITRIKSYSWVQHALYVPYRLGEKPTIRESTRDYLIEYFTEDVLLLDKDYCPGIASRWGY